MECCPDAKKHVVAPMPHHAIRPPLHSFELPRFSLCHTLVSGQVFRFRCEGDWFRVQTRDMVFRVRQRGKRLDWEGSRGVNARFIRGFFALDEDLGAVEDGLAREPQLAPLVRRCSGLRLIRVGTGSFSVSEKVPVPSSGFASVRLRWAQCRGTGSFSAAEKQPVPCRVQHSHNPEQDRAIVRGVRPDISMGRRDAVCLPGPGRLAR